jgi:hypothetical protein
MGPQQVGCRLLFRMAVGFPFAYARVKKLNKVLACLRLTVGTGREAVCQYEDTGELFHMLKARLFLGIGSLEDLRDFRLGLQQRLIEFVQRGLKIHLKDLPSFAVEMESVFTMFARARNIILPIRTLL